MTKLLGRAGGCGGRNELRLRGWLGDRVCLRARAGGDCGEQGEGEGEDAATVRWGDFEGIAM